MYTMIIQGIIFAEPGFLDIVISTCCLIFCLSFLLCSENTTYASKEDVLNIVSF